MNKNIPEVVDVQIRPHSVKCGINKVYLTVILLFLTPYVWSLQRLITKSEEVNPGTIIGLTVVFIIPIYMTLLQVKTIEIKENYLSIFYPFRLWTKTYDLNQLEKWKYRKRTKAGWFDISLRSRYVIVKFKGSWWPTTLLSVGLTNFEELLDYLNNRYRDSRTNRIFR